jgi:hypothetical protein
MSLKKLLGRSLSVLYGIWSLLMLAAAIASITHQMYIGTVVFITLASISFYMTFTRWMGCKGKRTEHQ